MNINTELIQGQSYFYGMMNHVIQATSISGYDNYGNKVLNNTTTRSYRCYVQQTNRMTWNADGTTEGLPYTAYILSIPLGQTDALPILETDVLQLTTPSYIPIRRFGTVQSYYDQFGNMHNIEIHFE